ncbi:MAG: hydroxymethylglutaryl-CoA lyase [Alphaproteobacteria bacterium]|jgi:hydroxymethylglutaryl-CoA lyase|nr:hydroxymethylglutaryl-CoA lyase [Alphaproteobacteria bacterium]
MAANPRRAVTIAEVGPRDGLQNLDRVLPTADKLAWIAAEAACGVPEIEVGSFVPPRLLPQMADTGDVLARLPDLPGTEISVLVPNLKGAERAVAAGARKLTLTISASEQHSLKNVRKTTAEQVEEFKQIIALRDSLDPAYRFGLAAGLSTVFGCTIQGTVPEADVVGLAAAVAEAGAEEVSLADTVGYADPAQVRRLVRAVRAAIGDRPMAGHFHDTRGLGLANVLAAFEEGVATFDSTLGGLGGCPYAPGASGNVVTEDLVFLFERMGVATGIDLERLIAVRRDLEARLPGVTFYGHLAHAGPPRDFRPVAA